MQKKIDLLTDVVYLDVDQIKPYWNNPRINVKTRDALVDAIKRIGFNQPILIDKKDVIVKGHARWLAAKMIGIDQIPVLYTNASDLANKEDRVLDNIIQELSLWDDAKLKEEISKIDFQISHIITMKEVMEKVDSSIPEVDPANDPTVFLTCPSCGKKHEISKSDLLEAEGGIYYVEDCD